MRRESPKLSNDLSEGIASGSVKDWRAVALYFRGQLDQANYVINGIRPSVAAMVCGQELIKHSSAEMAAWLKKVGS